MWAAAGDERSNLKAAAGVRNGCRLSVRDEFQRSLTDNSSRPMNGSDGRRRQTAAGPRSAKWQHKLQLQPIPVP